MFAMLICFFLSSKYVLHHSVYCCLRYKKCWFGLLCVVLVVVLVSDVFFRLFQVDSICFSLF